MRDQKTLLEDILNSIGIIEKALKGKSENKFKGSIILQDAVIRRFAVLGEASKHIPSELKARHREVDWGKVAGMRDFLVHEYFDIDLNIVWKAVQTDLPMLRQSLTEMLKEIK